MNFKKTWKRGTEGFTLVELIVVIAILAILAGIAVPAYSGYIKKANEAADLQLLGAVNTAFAATVLENGRDVSDVKAANLKEGAAAFSRARTAETGWTVGGVVVAFKEGKTPANFDAAEFSAAFMRYFGNGNAKFKVIELKDLAWDETAGGFGRKSDIEAKGGNVSYVLNGSAITVSAQAVTTLQNSTFGTAMGGEALMNEITGLTNMMSASDSKLANDLLSDTAAGGYMQKYAAYLGVENASNLVGDDLIAAVEEKLVETYTANGIVVDETNAAEMVNTALVNGMVFYAADGMKDYTVESATNLLTSKDIYNSLSKDTDTRLAEASLVYGMYAGFVNSEYNTGANKATSSTNDPMGAIKTISGDGKHSENFQKYLDSDQGKADIAAYMEAMNVVNNASGNEAAASVLVNGFSGSELESLLTQVLGK